MASETDQAEAAELPLAAEFPQASREQWLKLVDGVLKGGSFDRLKSRSAAGMAIEPLYPRKADARPIAARPAGAPWRIVQRVDHPDAKQANAQALIDLENGATGLALVFTGATGAAGFGLEASPAALAAALADVHLDAGIGIELQAGDAAQSLALSLIELAKARGAAPADCSINFGLDPIGAAALTGGSAAAWPELSAALGETARRIAEAGFTKTIATADGRLIHDAGGSEAQELAFVLSCAVAYLRALEQAGFSLQAARDALSVRLSADADQFLTLAKFRAVRKLFARIDSACGLVPAPLVVAADTAWRMLTERDADVNMLRATMATFSAALGGADSITVLPHTLAHGLPDAFARRIARNTQLILLEESNLEKVTDPAAGAGGIEALTDELCGKAWALSQQIEAAGGVFAALQAETIQQQVAAVRTQRDKDIARRKIAITGLSEFANLGERTAAVLPATPHALPRTLTEAAFEPLQPRRLATAFEQLRDRSDMRLTATGARPRLFLANLGTPAAFTARATFAKSFFEAGGIETIDNEGFWEIPTLVHEYRKSGAPLACLCSSDEVYGTNGRDAAAALKAAGAKAVYLAGRPGDREGDYRAAGVDDFIFVGVDALTTLRAAHAMVAAEPQP